jgi:hypothetical protein
MLNTFHTRRRRAALAAAILIVAVAGTVIGLVVASAESGPDATTNAVNETAASGSPKDVVAWVNGAPITRG